MAPGRERSGPPERRSLAPRSATITVMIRAAFAAAKNLKRDFVGSFSKPVTEAGFGKKAEEFTTVSAQVNG